MIENRGIESPERVSGWLARAQRLTIGGAAAGNY
jgi:hypothetical protein